jgi:transcription initiation factor TFIID subunit TAF12
MRRTRSLLGTAARTAVITGTAKAVLGSGKKGAAAPAEAPAPAAGMTEDRIAMLQKLSELQKSGVLTDEEFAAEKAKILAG